MRTKKVFWAVAITALVGHYSHLTGSVLRGGGISGRAAAYGPPRVVVIAQKTKNAAN